MPLKLSKNSAKALNLLKQWSKRSSVYNLKALQHIGEIQDPEVSDCCYLMEIPDTLRQSLNKQFYQFARTEFGDIYALWSYPQLIGDAPVVFFSSEGLYSMVAPSLEGLVGIMAEPKFLFPEVEDNRSNVWQDSTDWHPDLNELQRTHKLKSPSAVKELLQKEIAVYRQQVTTCFALKSYTEYMEEMQQHKNFRHWVQAVSRMQQDATGEIGGNFYDNSTLGTVASDFDATTVIDLLYKPTDHPAVINALTSLSLDSTQVEVNQVEDTLIDEEKQHGFRLMFKNNESRLNPKKQLQFDGFVAFPSWSKPLPMGIKFEQSFDSVVSAIGRLPDYRNKYIKEFVMWKMERNDQKPYLLSVFFNKDYASIKSFKMSVFTPENEAANPQGLRVYK